MAEGNIIINQSVHGYRGGHSLLASSVELSSQEKKELLLLSDLSGSGNESGFSEYYTGYPLTNSMYYAFAKTWYAHEMPRPGCVWTHTLLIDISVLWIIKDIKYLDHFFKRPTNNNYSEYSAGLSFSVENFKRRSEPSDGEFYWITDELYSHHEKLILLNKSSEKLTNAIFNVWSYQWPRLKRNFKFCTGAMSPRHQGAELFDLQVVPFSREKFISKSEKDKYHISLGENENPVSDWVADYRIIDPTVLEEFMTRFGSDVDGAVKKFLPLFRAYTLLYERDYSFDELMDFITDNFTFNEAKLLKANLIAKLLRDHKSKHFKLLHGILTNSQLTGLNWKTDELILNAWKNNQINAIELNKILALLLNGKKVVELDFLLSQIPMDVWIKNYSIYQTRLPDLLINLDAKNMRPVWQADSFIQDIWWEAIKVIERFDFESTINDMLSINNGRYAESILEMYGSAVFKVMFNYMLKTGKPVTDQWQYLVKLDPVQAFMALSAQKKLNDCLLEIIPNTLSPTASFWNQIEDKYFKDYLSKVSLFSNHEIVSGNYTFFLSAAFTRSVANPEALTILVFEPLHIALQENFCDQFTWQRFRMIMGNDLYELVEHDFFSKLFKERHEIPEWDKCEFLRRSLVSCFVKFRWDSKLLVKAISKDFIFKSIVKFGVESKPFKKMLKGLKTDLEFSQETDSFYYRILKKYLN